MTARDLANGAASMAQVIVQSLPAGVSFVLILVVQGKSSSSTGAASNLTPSDAIDACSSVARELAGQLAPAGDPS